MANYKIEEIQGIGPAYGEKLHQAGVKSTDAILKKDVTEKAAGAGPDHRSGHFADFNLE